MEYEKVEEKRTPAASAGEEESSIKHLKTKATEVVEQMEVNLKKVVEGLEKSQKLEEEARRLTDAAKMFQRTSGEVSSSFKRKNIKLVIAIVTVVVFIVIIIIAVIALVATGVIPVGTP